MKQLDYETVMRDFGKLLTQAIDHLDNSSDSEEEVQALSAEFLLAILYGIKDTVFAEMYPECAPAALIAD